MSHSITFSFHKLYQSHEVSDELFLSETQRKLFLFWSALGIILEFLNYICLCQKQNLPFDPVHMKKDGIKRNEKQQQHINNPWKNKCRCLYIALFPRSRPHIKALYINIIIRSAVFHLGVLIPLDNTLLTIFPATTHDSPWADKAIMIKCLAQEHNLLAIAGLKLVTYCFWVLHSSTRPHKLPLITLVTLT